MEKKLVVGSVALTLMMIAAFGFSGVATYSDEVFGYTSYADAYAFSVDQKIKPVVQEQGIVGLIISALIGVLVAGALLPTISESVADLEDNNTILDNSESDLVGLWLTMIIIGVLLGILAIAM